MSYERRRRPRRYRVIEVRFQGGHPELTRKLTIDGQLWSEVEWSHPERPGASRTQPVTA